MSKELQLKVRRPNVDWFKVLQSIVDEERWYELWCSYILMRKYSRKSQNFCAYQTLRHYYSPNRLEYLRWCVYGETDVISYEKA